LDDDIITFDNAAARREMRHRHAELGRRTLAVVSVALQEWEEKVARGEPLGLSPAEIEQLREIGAKMAHEADGDAPIPPPKPN
jgi:hypothetical protein